MWRGPISQDCPGCRRSCPRVAHCACVERQPESGKSGIPKISHPAVRENYSGQTPLLPGTVFAQTFSLRPNLSASFLPEPPWVAATRGGRGCLINGTHNVIKIREGKRKGYLIRPGRLFVLKQIKQPGIGKTASLRQEKLLCSRNIKMIRESWYLKG